MLRSLTILVFAFMLLSSQGFAQPTSERAKFLKLEGVSHLANSSATIQSLMETFLVPLQTNPKIALFSYVVQTQGEGHFFFHFIAQAMNQESVDQFNAYIQNLDSKNFQDIKIVVLISNYSFFIFVICYFY